MAFPDLAGRIEMDSIIFGLQRFGGISNYWDRLLERMRAQVPAHRLLLPREVLYAGFDPAVLRGTPARRERLPAAVSRYLPARPSGDIFHTSYYRWPTRRVAKYVVSVYDFIYERYRSGLAREVHTRQKLASIRRADDVICISHATREDVLRFCPDVDPSRVHVVHLGVDFGRFHPEPAAVADASDDNRSVLFVGARTGYKRFDLAIEALRQSPGLTLGIVGPALSDAEREQLTQRLGTRWIEHGAVSNERLRQLYSQSFAFMFPSDYEGFGLPVLEAMACGCPVVASSSASLPEVGGAAALYAVEQRADDYAQALARLERAGERATLVEHGLAHCRQFSWDRTWDETLAIYARKETFR